MLGQIELAKIEDMTKFTQRVASAMSAATAEMTGASYKPLLYLGKQQVRGTNYWFIAEQTLVLALPERHIVKLAVNEFNGAFALIPHSIEVIAG